MSISYTIDSAEKMIYVTYPPEIDHRAVIETMGRLAVDDRLEKDFCALVDLRATKSLPSPSEARVIASLASELFLHNPIALVVSSRVQYGVSNMVSIIAELRGATIQAFYEMEEAKAWLAGRRAKKG